MTGEIIEIEKEQGMVRVSIAHGAKQPPPRRMANGVISPDSYDDRPRSRVMVSLDDAKSLRIGDSASVSISVDTTVKETTVAR